MKNNQQDKDQFLQNKDQLYIARYGQFLQLKVNHNMLRSVMTINGQLQHVAISSTHYDQFWQPKVNYNPLQLVLIIKGQL